jgi:cell division protein FtsQ
LFIGGAPQGGADLVQAIAQHRAVVARVRAMQRISGRRWNLILDDGVVVKLPEEGWRQQLDSLEHLIVDKSVLERDIVEIDLRSPDNYFFVLRSGEQQQVTRGNKT